MDFGSSGEYNEQRNTQMKKQPIILVGGGGHCISCIDVVEQTAQYEIIGIIDQPEKLGTKVLGYDVIGNDEDIVALVKICPNFLITVGQIKTSDVRSSIYSKVKNAGGQLPVIVSPLAHVSRHAVIGEGTIIMHQAIINAAAHIGCCSIINTKALIEHETRVGEFCHISTGACVNGQVNIGSHSFVGSNAVVANNINISEHAVVSAGSVVLQNIDKPGVYIGNPLKNIG